MRVSIIGATGYAGAELLRLLYEHPQADVVHITSESHTGEKISSIYPHLRGIYDEEQNGEIILHLTEKELSQLESDLPHVLLDIYWYWQAIINKPQTVRREGEKIGRNDSCPCGSGKKYKACCGNG